MQRGRLCVAQLLVFFVGTAVAPLYREYRKKPLEKHERSSGPGGDLLRQAECFLGARTERARGHCLLVETSHRARRPPRLLGGTRASRRAKLRRRRPLQCRGANRKRRGRG